MILKKCINGSMILIDGISEVHVYEKDGFPWVQIQRGKETTTHRLDEPAFILNDEGKTIERLPYNKPQTISANTITGHIAIDSKEVFKAVNHVQKGHARKTGVSPFVQ